MTQDAWRIEGGVPLRGRVRPSGSKNGSLPLLAAALLLDGETILQNIPRIADIDVMLELLRAFGLEAEHESGDVRIVNRGLSTHIAPPELVSRMRASHYLLGPVVTQLGRAELPLPGGCDIGDRPVQYIIDGLQALGAEAEIAADCIRARADRLTGAPVALNPAYRSPGATFNVLMAAAMAEGTTVIENASYEPDVVGFCRFLAAAGARIDGIGTPTLTIQGVDRLTGVTHRANADRLEAGTFICAAAATRGDVVIEDVTLDDLAGFSEVLLEAGVRLEPSDGGLRASCLDRPRGVSLVTEPFPGFPTDLQPPTTALLSCAEGHSEVREGIFTQRLQCVEQLIMMGAFMRLIDGQCVAITGVESLHGAEIDGHNIRDGAALVVAALSARGTSTVSGRKWVARGYEDFESKLRSLGANIESAG
jgi:UDP-N-acetylglucosamine 1-carboxyvinyltransferase